MMLEPVQKEINKWFTNIILVESVFVGIYTQ